MNAVLLTRAKRTRTAGVVEISLGGAAMAGGLALMTVGRPASQLNTEDDTVREVRTMGGIVTLIAGMTTGLIGLNTLERAKAMRHQAEIAFIPLVDPHGGGLIVSARF